MAVSALTVTIALQKVHWPDRCRHTAGPAHYSPWHHAAATPYPDRRTEAMLRRPDVDEVMEYGRALGFDLTPMEARMIQARMMDTIAALETFDEMRVEERSPPLRFTDRDPGRRPSAAEDPLGAFITRCR